MKDNIVLTSMLACPDIDLRCALQKMLSELITVDLTYTSGVLKATINGVSDTIALPIPTPVPTPVPVPTPTPIPTPV